MKKLFFYCLVLLGVIFAFQFQSCQREPVYIGDLWVQPIDTLPIIIDTIPDDTIAWNLHPCDPDTVYFQKDVLPILISNCTMSGCHDVASHKEGVILVDYAHVLSTGGIKVSNPSNSKIYKSLFASGEDRMPQAPQPALTADQKAVILKWITQGAQDLTCDDCTTDNVTFAGSIAPLLKTHCEGCHGNVNPGGSIQLLNYNQIITQVDNGKLLGAVDHQAGFKPMPPNVSKMPACYIEQIQLWINDGAPNN
ncbi:MAG: hypothetical protein IPL49_12370 [Saprospirales bacterium]|nr:hypothetical protein [Saprospirales bacterium]